MGLQLSYHLVPVFKRPQGFSRVHVGPAEILYKKIDKPSKTKTIFLANVAAEMSLPGSKATLGRASMHFY